MAGGLLLAFAMMIGSAVAIGLPLPLVIILDLLLMR
jgi:hypothetical protein